MSNIKVLFVNDEFNFRPACRRRSTKEVWTLRSQRKDGRHFR